MYKRGRTHNCPVPTTQFSSFGREKRTHARTFSFHLPSSRSPSTPFRYALCGRGAESVSRADDDAIARGASGLSAPSRSATPNCTLSILGSSGCISVAVLTNARCPPRSSFVRSRRTHTRTHLFVSSAVEPLSINPVQICVMRPRCSSAAGRRRCRLDSGFAGRRQAHGLKTVREPRSSSRTKLPAVCWPCPPSPFCAVVALALGQRRGVVIVGCDSSPTCRAVQRSHVWSSHAQLPLRRLLSAEWELRMRGS